MILEAVCQINLSSYLSHELFVSNICQIICRWIVVCPEMSGDCNDWGSDAVTQSGAGLIGLVFYWFGWVG